MGNVRSLPGIYAFTGIDYLLSSHGKGKIRSMKIMRSQEKLVKAFVCHVYGYKKETNIHRVLALHFEAKCKPKKSGKPLDSIRNIDRKRFSPCQRGQLQQIKSAWFIANLYKTATSAYSAGDCDAINFG